MQAAQHSLCLRTLELRCNKLALEVGDAFSCLLAGTWALQPPASFPASLTQRSRQSMAGGRGGDFMGHLGGSTASWHRGMTRAAPLSSGTHLVSPLEVAAMSSHQQGLSRSGSFSVPSLHGAGGSLKAMAVDDTDEPQGGMFLSSCYLLTLDLGCNPLLGDVGVCKLAEGLALHCR